MADYPHDLCDSAGRSEVLVAERPDGGGLCGLLEARLRDFADGCAGSPVAYIEGWYVDPKFRKAGVGAALVREAERWARDLGVTELASDAEFTNDLGESAHLGLGFREVGRIIQYRKLL